MFRLNVAIPLFFSAAVILLLRLAEMREAVILPSRKKRHEAALDLSIVRSN